MVAGFVTGGKSPHVAAKLRRDFEANVSDNIESILDYLSEVRTLAKEKIDDDRKRAAYIREVSEFCMKADRVCSNKEENAFYRNILITGVRQCFRGQHLLEQDAAHMNSSQ